MSLVQQVHQVLLESQALLVHQDPRVPLEPREQSDPQVAQVPLELKEH